MPPWARTWLRTFCRICAYFCEASPRAEHLNQTMNFSVFNEKVLQNNRFFIKNISSCMKFYTIDIWEHFVSLKTLVWLASFSENSWEHYILRKPLLRKVRFYALVLPGLFVTKNVFFYSKKRRRRKKKLFSQWFSKKTLKIRVFFVFHWKN